MNERGLARLALSALIGLICLLAIECAPSGIASPTPERATATPTPLPTFTATPFPTATSAPTATPLPTFTVVPTPTPTLSRPTPTAIVTPTATGAFEDDLSQHFAQAVVAFLEHPSSQALSEAEIQTAIEQLALARGHRPYYYTFNGHKVSL